MTQTIESIVRHYPDGDDVKAAYNQLHDALASHGINTDEITPLLMQIAGSARVQGFRLGQRFAQWLQ